MIKNERQLKVAKDKMSCFAKMIIDTYKDEDNDQIILNSIIGSCLHDMNLLHKEIYEFLKDK